MFNKAIEILYLAKQESIEIVLNEEQLQLKLPKNKPVDQDLLQEIKNNKEAIVAFLKNRKKTNKTYEKITAFDRKAIQRIPLSFSQERLWFINQIEGSVHYHIPAVLRLKGFLHKEALSYALKMFVDRHEVLRTVFKEEEGKPYQYFIERKDWQLSTIDGSVFNGNEIALHHHIQGLINTPFDLSQDFTFRASLLCFNDQEHLLVVVMHHIASDGWSLPIMVKEIAELYNAYKEDREAQLEPLELQYADYAIWQRKHLQGEVLDKKLNYWKEKLQGVAALQLPTDYQRPAVQSTRGATLLFDIEKDLYKRLQSLSQQQGTTLFMTLLAAFKVLLYRYSSQNDICVGTPIANRTQEETEALVGFFVNALALRSEVIGESSFIELLQQVKVTTLEAFKHQEVPFEKLVEALVRDRDLSRSPLFQVMFALQNQLNIEVHLGEVELSSESFTNDSAKFEITFHLTETKHGLQGTVEYATDLYKKETIEQLITHYQVLLSSIIEAPQQKIGTLPMLTSFEKQKFLTNFNDTKVAFPKDKTIVALFEEQAVRTPDNIAIVIEQQQISYKELNVRANQIAHLLSRKGIEAETLVPICLERSLEMIVGILGILKAGGAYVP
ncbi:MAG: condensation domain-containing protein, partial [Bacteroidota bacterium]|nr:condensation domain-containing protein [Bacteroidota bacterium]